MFIRVKGIEPYRYLQVVENHREGKRTVQRVLCTLGRVDQLTASGATDSLLRSLARFGQRVQLVEGYQQGQLEAGAVRKIGPDLAFGRLWSSTGLQEVLRSLLDQRHFEFPVERAVYLAVLHRGCSNQDRIALANAGSETFTSLAPRPWSFITSIGRCAGLGRLTTV